MEESESPKQMQNDELESLQAIYYADITVNEKAQWLDVSIALQPMHDSRNSEVHATVVMRVECDENYPRRVPKISFTESKGLSNVQIDTLQSNVEERALEMEGEVMIYELTVFVRQYLLDNNIPATQSFYDEMIKRKFRDEQLRNLHEEKKKTKERADIIEKVNMKEAYTDFSSDENSLSNSDEEVNGGDGGRRVRFMPWIQNLNEGEQACGHRSSKYIQFGTKIIRGRCMEHDEHSVIYHGIDSASGEPCVVREYILKPQEKQTIKELFSHVLKQLESIKTELHYLKRIKHTNLVAYIDFAHVTEKDHLVTYIVQEFVSNVTLSYYRQWHIEIDFSFIRHVVISLLEALVCLHQNNVIHRNVRSSSVYISKTGVVKLADCSVANRMEDLQLSCMQIRTGGGKTRPSRSTDVIQLAALLLSLIGVPADPANRPDLPDTVPLQIKDFLDKCYLDENRRWTAKQLLDHGFVQTSLPPEISTRSRRRLSSVRSLTEDVDGDDNEEDNAHIISQLNIPNDLKSQSRLSSEFRVLKYLGSGSFGKVLKAKNRLDGGIYAIKVIELKPRNEQLNRKMIREVKLLSKLNHENVVRYYNSWMETTNVDNRSSVTQVTTTPLQSLTETQTTREKIAGMSQISVVVDEEGDDDEESDSSDEEEVESEESPARISNPEPSESIMFVDSTNGDIAKDSAIEDDVPSLAEGCKQLRSLYIQMEFCERSTLRIAIDQDGLCNDPHRYWRLVRETIEGLAYIHQQDMIHRDLKPVNIFLDSCDHVKIGDFGLATTSVLKNNFVLPPALPAGIESENSSHLHTEDSHTGGVGTSFYVAPELQKPGGKAHYNKKVDIYSLGIILFEMAHPPFTTQMERSKTLGSLRKAEIISPCDMESTNPLTMKLVTQMLNHDPNKRPTCSEILAGSILPPPQVEESELQDFIRHTLSNPQSKAYKYLISSCFQQKPQVEDDLTYHADGLVSDRCCAVQEMVRDVVIQVMRRHGARCVVTPLFLPQTEQHAAPEAYVRLMTHSGSVVLAPRDLRVPLARLVARTGVTRMRRYCVERVYRERRTHGYHPRESLECAFDIVTPTPGELNSDADVISVLQEILSELPAIKSRKSVLRVNHTLLLEAVLLAWGLEKHYQSIFQVLCDATDGKHSKLRLTTNLESASVSSQQSVHLVDFFNKEEPLVKISPDVIALVKRRDEAFVKAKRALDQLKVIINHADDMGNKIPIVVCPGLAHTSPRCSGVMFDLCMYGAARKRNKESFEILATGCRYDGLVEDFRKVFRMQNNAPDDLKQSAVGISVSLDKLVKAVIKDDLDNVGRVRVVLCSLGQDAALMRTKSNLVRDLRGAGVTSYVLDNVVDVDDVETDCQENQVSHIVWLKETERVTARVRIWDSERERYIEKKMPVSDVVDSISKFAAAWQASESDMISRPSVSEVLSSQTVNINIIAEEKIQANNRRRYEAQIRPKITQFLQNFSAKPTIEVLGVFLESKIIKTIAANLEFSDAANDFAASSKTILDSFPRQRKYLSKVCDKIYNYCFSKENVVVIIYSLNDDKFKQVT